MNDTSASVRHTCCATVSGEKVFLRYHYKPCGRTATVERNGKWYCKMHDPVRIREREDARREENNAQWKAEDNRRMFVIACEDAIRRIAAHEPDPVAIARNVLASEFGGSK